MLEIFIPTEIKWYHFINKLPSNFYNILEKNFYDINLQSFDSKFFTGIKLKSKNINNDLIILMNWLFWKNYFISYDWDKYDIIKSLGQNLILNNNIWEIEWISERFENIIKDLKSEKLITKTKKEEILSSIQEDFFNLSSIVFSLYNSLEETISNINDLNDIKDNQKAEFSWQAIILLETNETRKIKIQASIDQVEWMLEIFIWVLSKIVK